MSRSTSTGHALETLSAILRLPEDVGQTAALSAAMRNGRIGWAATTALAERHLLLPALWPALLDKKLMQPVPPALRQFIVERDRNSVGRGTVQNVFVLLEQRFDANAARNRAIRNQLGGIVATLNRAGIRPGLIKGARLLLAGKWPYVASRCLRDIDLLLSPADWAAGVAALNAIGYRSVLGDLSNPQGGATLTKPAEPAEIDLHAAPLSLHEPMALPPYLTPQGFWDLAETVTEDGLVYRRLPAAESLVHAVVHTEIADLNYAAGDWALRYLYETAVLTQDPAQPLDWLVLTALERTPLARPLKAHLLAAQDLFGAALPEGFAATPAARRQYRRCRRNLHHPRSLRRCSMLAHKFRQAMSEWYLRRKGYYPGTTSTRTGLWQARLRLLRDLSLRHGPRLRGILLGGTDDPLPPPRV
jgi:hypothetical protein